MDLFCVLMISATELSLIIEMVDVLPVLILVLLFQKSFALVGCRSLEDKDFSLFRTFRFNFDNFRSAFLATFLFDQLEMKWFSGFLLSDDKGASRNVHQQG